MLVKKLSLTNFRNYRSEQISFGSERNVIIGENAQGKTNLLEAIEYASSGRSYRTSSDAELILHDADHAIVEIDFVSRNYDQKISIAIRRKAGGSGMPKGRQQTEKQIKVNGVPKANSRGLRGHLVTVGFKTQDMSLIRGGPSDRRDWIDDLACSLKTGFSAVLSRYEKAVAQRNKLLKMLFEKGRLSVTDQDQLKVWDQQLATLGATIIKQRVGTLNLALPIAEKYQEKISGSREQLSANYNFYTSSSLSKYGSESNDDDYGSSYQTSERDFETAESSLAETVSMAALLQMEESAIAQKLMKLYKMRRGDEIARRQTLSGPHRDDVRFSINDTDATAFGSQGQQRSLVLALKLSELALVSDHLDEPPVLLLDDVMAELDLRRQGFLMESVDRGMQTLITTTHLDGFEQEWLAGASLISVTKGAIERQEMVASAGQA